MLLDEAGNAKVADFGTVRECALGRKEGEQRTATHTFTGLRVGTRGYTSRKPPALALALALALAFRALCCRFCMPLRWPPFA